MNANFQNRVGSPGPFSGIPRSFASHPRFKKSGIKSRPTHEHSPYLQQHVVNVGRNLGPPRRRMGQHRLARGGGVRAPAPRSTVLSTMEMLDDAARGGVLALRIVRGPRRSGRVGDCARPLSVISFTFLRRLASGRVEPPRCRMFAVKPRLLTPVREPRRVSRHRRHDDDFPRLKKCRFGLPIFRTIARAAACARLFWP